VRGNSDALLAGADGEVELGLDHPQPVVGLERVIRVAEGGGLQMDEPLDLPREVLVLRSDTVSTVATVLHGFSNPLHQLSLERHHLHQVRWGWWRLVRLRLALLGPSLLNLSLRVLGRW
jgi:hypothetical protein